MKQQTTKTTLKHLRNLFRHLTVNDFSTIPQDQALSIAITAVEKQAEREKLDREQQTPRAEAYRVVARRLFQEDGECEVDDNAIVSFGDDPGAYVAAWVWVPKCDVDEYRRQLRKTPPTPVTISPASPEEANV